MFALRQLSINPRRFGLGLAVAALALSTIVAPLSASAQEHTDEYTVETVPMAQQEGKPPIVIPVKADLQVIARGKRQVGKTTQYHFVIKNSGPANAPQITAYKEAQTKALIGNGFNLTDNGYFNLSLNAGQSHAVTINCTPAAGFYCSQGTVLVFMNNMADPDSTNDIAVIN